MTLEQGETLLLQFANGINLGGIINTEIWTIK